VLLSVVIVASILWIMRNYRRTARIQRRADDIDHTVQQLEVDLFGPLTQLRNRMEPAAVEERTKQASEALLQSAMRFSHAADQLRDSTDLVEQLSTVIDRMASTVDRMAATIPELERQTALFAQIDQQFRDTANTISEQMRPVVTVVTNSAVTVDAARDIVTRSANLLTEAEKQLAIAQQVSAESAEHRTSLEATQRPFTSAADNVARAAEKLDHTTAALQETVKRLQETIKEVNWLAMVSDGLRHADDNHRPSGDPRQIAEESVG
jgi:methyl-accepting chemotaxis protein